MADITGWNPAHDSWPFAPVNGTVMSAFTGTSLDIRWDDPSTLNTGGSPECPGKSNSQWDIVGVNIYRSDTGERGPYFRINKIPIGVPFYQDRTDLILVDQEVVSWDAGWIYKGDAPGGSQYRMRTQFRPVVKSTGNAVPADSPSDVHVTIDGRVSPVLQVFGQTGIIDLDTTPVWDPATESYIYPPVPDNDSVVLITYYRQGNVVTTNLDTNAKIFYRLTTVAIDPSGQTPSGLVETPLTHSPPISAMDSERYDYIWAEAVRRNRWILEQGGERVKGFIRRATGIQCPCQWDAKTFAFAKQPYNYCLCCYGTGFLGGYEGPFDLIIAPDDSERRVTQTPMGRKLDNTYEVWTGPRPILSQRDFIVKQNGERYSIGPVRRVGVRGLNLQQSFQIGYLDSQDIRYAVPMGPLETLPWPETRYTNPQDVPCEDNPPYPIGYEYQATPMGTDVSKIPEGRQVRGRTPVWANIMYGGNGGGSE
jgi:hypothetical protein